MLSLRSLPGALAFALALGGCGVDAVPTPDVPRFDARDAIIDPRPDAPAWDAGADAPAPVDVIPFDAVPPGDVGRDAPAFDAPRPDAPPMCEVLAEAYASAVRACQTCAREGECATLVCETQCCACQVYVNHMSPRYAELLVLRARWVSEGCAATVLCPRPACARPTGAACSPERRCVTLRASTGDAGRD